MTGLTVKQKRLFEYIKSYIENFGVSPSYDEMMFAMKLKSKSGIHRLVTALVERGYLHKFGNRARSLSVVGETELEKLKAENARLREALKVYADPCDAATGTDCGYEGNMCCKYAREALSCQES